ILATFFPKCTTIPKCSGNDAKQLGVERVKASLGPDDVVGKFELPFDRPLSGKTPANLLLAPAALLEPPALGHGRTRDTDDRVKQIRGAGLKEQRYHHQGVRATLGAQILNPILPRRTNARMQNGLQCLSRRRDFENDLR